MFSMDVQLAILHIKFDVLNMRSELSCKPGFTIADIMVMSVQIGLSNWRERNDVNFIIVTIIYH